MFIDAFSFQSELPQFKTLEFHEFKLNEKIHRENVLQDAKKFYMQT